MGYFSNGSEGMDYEARYCARCVHQKADAECPVWFAHTMHNSEQIQNEGIRSVLTALIPRDGIWNAQCAMFHHVGEETT